MQQQPELVGHESRTRGLVGVQAGFVAFDVQFHFPAAAVTLLIDMPGTVSPGIGDHIANIGTQTTDFHLDNHPFSPAPASGLIGQFPVALDGPAGLLKFVLRISNNLPA